MSGFDAPRIHILCDQLANQIAAGEVVERPASVVKELVENGLDAEAKTIEIEIENGGLDLIRVVDDGVGMTREEALLCIKRHATSKIHSADDLAAIRTLGFRGEALPSILSVSRFELLTRTTATDVGVRLRGGDEETPTIEDAGVPRGTSVTVRDLFHNIPARRKFMRRPTTEASRVGTIVSRIAMGHPHVRFRLTHNGRKQLDLAPERKLANRVFGILGRKVTEHLYPLALEDNVQVEGLVSAPHVTRVNADGMYTYINGRFVRDPMVQHAIRAAYGGLLERGRHPYVVLFIRVRPDQLDVNVHPAKEEVRFVNGGEVHTAIIQAIRATLAQAPWLTKRPDEDDAPKTATSPAPLPPRGEWSPVAPAAEKHSPYHRANGGKTALEFEPESGAPPSLGVLLRELETEGAEKSAAPKPGFFSGLRYVGQVGRLYLICESDSALHLIDQHAAHERVTYERLMAGFRAGKVPMQNLLLPVHVEVRTEELATVEEHEETIARMGLDIVPFGNTTLALRAVPAFVERADYVNLVQDLVAELHARGRSHAMGERTEALAAKLACHSSVRGGDVVTPQEARTLLLQLDEVDFRANCPHGRPVIVTHPLTTVARWFERTS